MKQFDKEFKNEQFVPVIKRVVLNSSFVIPLTRSRAERSGLASYSFNSDTLRKWAKLALVMGIFNPNPSKSGVERSAKVIKRFADHKRVAHAHSLAVKEFGYNGVSQPYLLISLGRTYFSMARENTFLDLY